MEQVTAGNSIEAEAWWQQYRSEIEAKREAWRQYLSANPNAHYRELVKWLAENFHDATQEDLDTGLAANQPYGTVADLLIRMEGEPTKSLSEAIKSLGEAIALLERQRADFDALGIDFDLLRDTARVRKAMDAGASRRAT